MAYANQPTNLNYLNVVSFQTNFLRMPTVDYFCQRVGIPGISLSSLMQSTPFAGIPMEGDNLVFEDLSIEFIIDEDLKNYMEIYNWMQAIGFPDNFDQYDSEKDKDLKSDGNIIIHTNKANPNYNVTFKDIFPVALGGINFDTNATSLEPIVVNAVFRYTGAFSVKKIG